MDRPVCKTCPYWEYSFGGQETPDGGTEYGDCQRFPPKFPPTKALHSEAEQIEGQFWQGWQPTTSEHQGCGEHPDFPAYIASLKRTPTVAMNTNSLSVRARKIVKAIDMQSITFDSLVSIKGCGFTTAYEIVYWAERHGIKIPGSSQVTSP